MGSIRPACVAHISDDGERSESVQTHLMDVAEMAARFAKKFGFEDWGYAAGILHDIGKYSAEFQHRILDDGPRVDHSTAGASVAVKEVSPWLAYCIAGHHGGLPDGGVVTDFETTLSGRLNKANKGQLPAYDAYKREIELPANPPVPFPVEQSRLTDKRYRNDVQYAWTFFVRMVYSCLVDADFLCTERFMANQSRPSFSEVDLGVMRDMLEDKLAGFYPPTTRINEIRCGVLDDCRKAADLEPGVFSLTVPTGGGKTFALMRFALHHATAPGRVFDRVICVEPYTSIIEQNAAVYRDVFGEDAVLEHHSNYDFEKGTRAEEGERDDAFSNPARLAAENWDAPLIVTTNVQLFESLYASKPSRCRKLHNIARSVIVLDEAQMIPVNYLQPCIKALAELVKRYGCSVVLCTATQPALNDLFAAEGLTVREIASNPVRLVEGLRRVRYHSLGCLTDEELAERVGRCGQALCIVNSRRQARALYELLQSEGDSGDRCVYHLSTLMHPIHRSRVIGEIRAKVREGLPCVVVSTSLVEAGVDLDFAFVFRAVAGIDSMVQAAGRCNREMRRASHDSIVYLFEPEMNYALPPEISQCAEVARLVAPGLREAMDDLELDSLQTVHAYFSALYEHRSLDDKSIVSHLSEYGISGSIPSIPYDSVASSFQMVKSGAYPVIIPSEHNAKDIDALTSGKPSRDTMRRLGRWSVNVYKNDRDALLKSGSIEPVGEGIFLLLDDARYSEEFGLDVLVEGGVAMFL